MSFNSAIQIREQQDLLQISTVHRLDAEAREEHLKGELMRREQLSLQAQQVDEADQSSLKVNYSCKCVKFSEIACQSQFGHFLGLAVAPSVTLSQERVAYLQQQMQKEEEMAAAAKSRLEQAQSSRITAEEELAKQELLFAEMQVKLDSSSTMSRAPPFIEAVFLMHRSLNRRAYKRPTCC